jgi:hypothetical protein
MFLSFCIFLASSQCALSAEVGYGKKAVSTWIARAGLWYSRVERACAAGVAVLALQKVTSLSACWLPPLLHSCLKFHLIAVSSHNHCVASRTTPYRCTHCSNSVELVCGSTLVHERRQTTRNGGRFDL